MVTRARVAVKAFGVSRTIWFFVLPSNDTAGVYLRCDTNNNNPRQATDSTIGFRCCGP
jgi:hypothetical protein